MDASVSNGLEEVIGFGRSVRLIGFANLQSGRLVGRSVFGGLPGIPVSVR